MSTLRQRVAALAEAKPELRKHLIPLLREASYRRRDLAQVGWVNLRGVQDDRASLVDEVVEEVLLPEKIHVEDQGVHSGEIYIAGGAKVLIKRQGEDVLFRVEKPEGRLLGGWLYKDIPWDAEDRLWKRFYQDTRGKLRKLLR